VLVHDVIVAVVDIVSVEVEAPAGGQRVVPSDASSEASLVSGLGRAEWG
jgi:hypothetical protein